MKLFVAKEYCKKIQFFSCQSPLEESVKEGKKSSSFVLQNEPRGVRAYSTRKYFSSLHSKNQKIRKVYPLKNKNYKEELEIPTTSRPISLKCITENKNVHALYTILDNVISSKDLTSFDTEYVNSCEFCIEVVNTGARKHFTKTIES